MAQETYPQPIAPPYFAHDKIDLRVYINVVLRYWPLIVTITLLTAVGTGAASIVYNISQAPQYEAVALLTTGQGPLVTSGPILQQLQSSVAPDLSLNELRDMLTVERMQDAPQIIQLKVRSDERNRAVQIANELSHLLLMGAIDEPVGQPVDDQKELERLSAIYGDLFSQQSTLTVMRSHIKRIQASLAKQPADAPVTSTDELSAILFPSNIFNNGSSNKKEATSDFMPQLSQTEWRSHKTAGERLAWLNQLLFTIQEKSNQIDGSLPQLEIEIKQIKEKIALSDGSDDMASPRSTERVELVSPATVLQDDVPINPRTLTYIALAAVVGMMIALALAFCIDSWPQQAKPTKEMAHG